MSPWSEDRLHAWLARDAPRGFGDDAFALSAGGGRRVVCVDQCIEGVHFEPGVAAARIGHKACARTLSDLAASAARPVAVLCALSAEPSVEERTLRGVLSAVRRTARAFGAELVGGDLSVRSGPLGLAVTALGDVATSRVPRRDRARAGELVILTGPCGGSSLGRHLRITPRIEAGQHLARVGASALMDVSDGVALDLHRLARAAGVGATLRLDALPVHRDARRLARTSGRDPLDHALHDGEDHELLATLRPAAWKRLRRERPGLFRQSGALAEARVVGELHRGSGLTLATEAGERRWNVADGGWLHGARALEKTSKRAPRRARP